MQRGEILGVVGGSVSGKSVLMRSILGLRRPQGSSIEALGHDVLAGSEADHRVIERRTGVLFQDGALFSSLNVAENVRSEEHTSELQSLMRISYAVSCLKKKTQTSSSTRTPLTSHY